MERYSELYHQNTYSYLAGNISRLISRLDNIPWPACSPDLTANNFVLWGYLKSQVPVMRPQNITELKVRIRQKIQNIMPQLLSSHKRFQMLVEQCVEMREGYLLDTIFKS
jgi:hypothetical protein